jgi:hypothetical protein
MPVSHLRKTAKFWFCTALTALDLTASLGDLETFMGSAFIRQALPRCSKLAESLQAKDKILAQGREEGMVADGNGNKRKAFSRAMA